MNSWVAGWTKQISSTILQRAWRSVLVCGNGDTMQLPTDRRVLLRFYSIRTIEVFYSIRIIAHEYKRLFNVK